jgi:hypothetical protein
MPDNIQRDIIMCSMIHRDFIRKKELIKSAKFIKIIGQTITEYISQPNLLTSGAESAEQAKPKINSQILTRQVTKKTEI